MRKPILLTNTDNKSSAFRADLSVLVADLKKVEDVAVSLGTPSIAIPCSIHDANGVLHWTSAGLAELIGLDPDKEYKTLLENIQVQDRVAIAHFLANASNCKTEEEKGAEFRSLGSVNVTPTAQWVELSSNIIHGNKSGEIFNLVTYSNISGSKQSAESASLLQEEAEKASVAKSQFLANISHELRTPLNAILGFSELMNSPLIETFNQEKRGEYIGLIHDSASHLLTLLNGILDMSKIENGMYEIFPESFCFSNCLTNTTAIMRGQAAATKVQIETIGFENMPDIIADERAVKQILINLLSNAIKFSHDGGRVLVKAERRARTISILVQDEGVGISPENLENLGKPFFQADSKYDRKYEGTGLGLSVVKGLIELHSGSVSFKSQRGTGTTVTLTLPIYGKTGRQVPASATVEKIASIRPTDHLEETELRITRNTA